MSRPEHLAPPEIYYNESEAKKYSCNSRIIEIQTKMSERAIELMALPDDKSCFILDLGCGSGISGEVLESQGHYWQGVDISDAMLNIAVEREVEGSLALNDLGQGLPFRAGTFDGAISISALQWLCNADKRAHHPPKRLYKLFSDLYGCLSRGSRAIFQFYPESEKQVEMITHQAMKAGFSGGLVVDFPNSSKAKKMFLVLMTGGECVLPAALGGAEQSNYAKNKSFANMKGKSLKSHKEWILEKKERRRRQNKEVRADSKYTARKRCGKF